MGQNGSKNEFGEQKTSVQSGPSIFESNIRGSEEAHDNHEAGTTGTNEVERRAACDTDRGSPKWVRNEQPTLRVGAAVRLGSNAIDQAMMRRAKNEQAMLRVGTVANAENNASCEGACVHETRVMLETLVGLHLEDVDTLPGLTRVGATRGLFH